MYLLDTNILLEFLLDQKSADDVEHLLRDAAPGTLYLSGFSLYSIGIVLIRRKMHDVFLRAVNDLLVEGGMRLVRLGARTMPDISEASRKYGLDFDDAYQYVAAEKRDLTIVSLDADFDRTERGRRTPAQVAGVRE